jgi:putative transposase
MEMLLGTYNPKNTSQMCFGCGQIAKDEFSERIHSYPFCGLILNEDHNAAINILSLGLQSVRKTDKSPHFSEGVDTDLIIIWRCRG